MRDNWIYASVPGEGERETEGEKLVFMAISQELLLTYMYIFAAKEKSIEIIQIT